MTEHTGRPRLVVISAIGISQILAWGSSYYLPAVLAKPVADATGWPMAWVVGALSLGLLVSGIVSPRVGHLIHRHGGRPVLAGSAVLLAGGLAAQSVAPNVAVFVAAWLIVGVGMGAGLYDPAFSTLGRLYGEQARSAITQLTLFGGFASTVCWPLSAFFVESFGWRGACLAYAIINVAIVLPLYLFGIPREVAHVPITPAGDGSSRTQRVRPEHRLAFFILAAGLTLASVIMTVVSVHLLTLLQARGFALATAVSLGMLVGPAQVGARVLEAAFGRRLHPIWSLLVSALLVTVGLAMLLGGGSEVIAIGIVLYGSGSGLRSIARGTVPLALFGRDGYAVLMGWLAMPILISQAASPSIGSLLMDNLGTDTTIVVLVAAAAVNIVSVLLLIPIALRRGVVAA